MKTIKDVARLAGVSVATVSRYLNNPSLLLKETGEQVQAAIDELGYQPNSIGRNLRMSRTHKILVVLPTISNPFYSQVLKGIYVEASHLGYTVLTCVHEGKPEQERDFLQMLRNRFVDAAILFNCLQEVEALNALARQFPVVQASEYLEGASTSYVAIDDYQASCDVISHFHDCGHRRIAFVGAGDNYTSARLRKEGYLDTLKRLNIPFVPEYFIESQYGFQWGVRGAQQLLSLREPPTAVFAIADTTAVGVVHEALERGVAVGRDLCVFGFDNTTMSKTYTPSISTVAQPRYELGRAAVEMLMKKVGDLNSPDEKRYLPHQLIVRQSSD